MYSIDQTVYYLEPTYDTFTQNYIVKSDRIKSTIVETYGEERNVFYELYDSGQILHSSELFANIHEALEYKRKLLETLLYFYT